MQSSQATAQNHQVALGESIPPPRAEVDSNDLDLTHRDQSPIERMTTTDYPVDASTLEAQPVHTQNKIGSNGTGHEMLRVSLFVIAFISSHGVVSSNTPSQFPVLLHFAISACCLYFLIEILGGHYISLTGIALAVAISLFDIYRSSNTSVFVAYAIVVGPVASVFLGTALFRVKPAQSSTNGSKLFAVTSLVLKQLLENDVVPMDTYPNSCVLNDVQSALFAASFLLSIMALWLQASGIAPLSPSSCGSASPAPSNRASILASALFWTGSAFTVAYVIMTSVLSSTTTPTIATIACVSFVVCTAAVLIKYFKVD